MNIRISRSLLGFWLLFACNAVLLAAEVIPPVPKAYFNDYAGVVSPATATRLNQALQDFERDTSNQLLVAVYPKMQSDSSIEDYTVRVAQSWRVGQKARNNGAVLFIFVQDRKMFLQVGYGLEGALPDALAKQILENELKPRFRNGNYDDGLSAGVAAMMAATKGEYRGTGQTARGRQSRGAAAPAVAFLIVLGFFVLALALSRARGVGRRRAYYGGWTIGSGGYSSSSWGGGGSSGGGFSAGGGSFGGGGAGGSW